MSDEPAKIILGDTAIERRSRRRWFGRRKDQEPPPLTHCENCGTQLTGQYCPKCGQAAIDYRRSFGHVLLDVLNEFVNWDSKFFGTLGLLVTRPWQLTNEFVEGKRVRHVHPLRLYLLASVGFFFAVNYWTKDLSFEPGTLGAEDRAKAEAMIKEKSGEIEAELDNLELPPDQRRKAQEALNYLSNVSPSPTPTASPGVNSSPSPAAPVPPGESDRRDYGAVGARPFLVFDEKESSSTPFEHWLETRLKEKLGEHGTKMGLFADTFFKNLPYMMFCCIPIFALVLKVLYIRRHILYIDHLIYALHIHSFFYTGLMLIVLITIGVDRIIPGAVAGWIIALLWIWFVAQIFLSIRRVYRQGWFTSIFKFFLGGFVYLMVLFLGVVATAMAMLVMPD